MITSMTDYLLYVHVGIAIGFPSWDKRGCGAADGIHHPSNSRHNTLGVTYGELGVFYFGSLPPMTIASKVVRPLFVNCSISC